MPRSISRPGASSSGSASIAASTVRRASADESPSASIPKSAAMSVLARVRMVLVSDRAEVTDSLTSLDASRFMAASTRQTASEALRFGMSAAWLVRI
eukprot:scaffold267808_cov25-Tisochrysis_lutea.AAC.3